MRTLQPGPPLPYTQGMVSTSIDIRKLVVLGIGVGSGQRRKNLLHADAICTDPMESALFVLGDVCPAESEIFALESGLKSFSNPCEVLLVKLDTADEILNLDDGHHMKVDIFILWTSAIDHTSKKSVPVFRFGHENYGSARTVANLDRITRAPHPLRKVLAKRMQKCRISVNSDRFLYTKNVFTASLHLIKKVHD